MPGPKPPEGNKCPGGYSRQYGIKTQSFFLQEEEQGQEIKRNCNFGNCHFCTLAMSFSYMYAGGLTTFAITQKQFLNLYKALRVCFCIIQYIERSAILLSSHP